jgi:hypothetical protein
VGPEQTKATQRRKWLKHKKEAQKVYLLLISFWTQLPNILRSFLVFCGDSWVKSKIPMF